MENTCTLKKVTGNWKYYCNLLSIDFHRFLDIAWHKQMVEAKKLDEDKNVDTVVRVKNYKIWTQVL